MKTLTIALLALMPFCTAVRAQSGSSYFITKWNTTLDTTTNGRVIQFFGEGTNYTISINGLDTSWAGDLTASGFINIEVPKAGSYTIIAYSGQGSFEGYSNYGGGSGTPQTDSRDNLTEIVQWGNTKFKKLNFNKADNLNITATDVPDLSNISDLQEAFAYCPSLKGNTRIGDWDVSNVTIMYKMFQGDIKFSQDLSHWKLAKAVNLGQMFSYSGMSTCNYTKTLNGWAANAATARDVFFTNQDETHFSNNTGRDQLIAKGWKISGDSYSQQGGCEATAEVGFNNITSGVTNGQLAVNWTTTTETSTDHFEIEASSDSSKFSVIGSTPSKAVDGNSVLPLNYNFTTPYKHALDIIGAFGFVAFAFVQAFRTRKKLFIILVLVLAAFAAIPSCKKTSSPGTGDDNKKIYIRIAHIDKAGTKTYSDVIVPTMK